MFQCVNRKKKKNHCFKLIMAFFFNEDWVKDLYFMNALLLFHKTVVKQQQQQNKHKKSNAKQAEIALVICSSHTPRWGQLGSGALMSGIFLEVWESFCTLKAAELGAASSSWGANCLET